LAAGSAVAVAFLFFWIKLRTVSDGCTFADPVFGRSIFNVLLCPGSLVDMPIISINFRRARVPVGHYHFVVGAFSFLLCVI
jgi:hypothetical protein